MREAIARARFVRMSPLKARLVINEIRGKPVAEARQILALSPQKASRFIRKVLDSAVANAQHNFEMDADKLFVVRAVVDEGPRVRRLNPRAFGRADIVRRAMAHITVAVAEKEE
ncbi:MAG TPA: 50S ribosomal protein L22 [Candidatus Bipolaricaulis sp.]|nr:50S ribosomal protein L22 [Candidatus Bipolaricaulis sp.]MDY0393045.1 50S ribosomal protein L22 [Candidatus Bipolaricaulis sp.]HPD07135.1 50S ribosomal protein L22 [Candidatus Bipolaricaulis sp.]HRS13595.1 50S ribosomal protein L22 [Candidatus Bipolaricaulis sp.]HRU21975.1 50S ribosomal protein L22 [Candidatus Bipolaricaulis sp.]